METTKMYIELIVIGLEAFIWMCIFIIDIIGDKVISILNETINDVSFSLLLIGILYIIGILIDRLSDIVFQKYEDKIRNDSHLETKIGFIVWKKYNLESFADYTRSRMRILRASIINISLIMLSLIWYIFKFYRHLSIIIYVLLVGIVFICISWKGYKKSLTIYYNKARVLELNDRESQ